MANNKKLIRCVPSAIFYDISRGTYNFETVRVYFGFDNYRADVEQIVELCEAIMEAYPGVILKNMDVCSISRVQSDRHANQTMVCVPLASEIVRNNLSEYAVL